METLSNNGAGSTLDFKKLMGEVRASKLSGDAKERLAARLGDIVECFKIETGEELAPEG